MTVALSIIIPAHNAMETIEEQIDALRPQSTGDVEIIVVDNASSDGSPEIVREQFGDPRVRMLELPENVGFGAANNRAAEIARGRRVVFACYSAGSRDRLAGVLGDHGVEGVVAVERWREVLRLVPGAIGAVVLGLDHGFETDDLVVLAGMFLGGIFPFLVSGMTMTAVGDAAFDMIREIRRQFKEIPGLLEGTAEPDTDRCVEIATTAALKRMVPPGVLAVGAPVVVGFTLGPAALGGMLGGALLGCVLLALTMANAGGAWDNAKKYIEKGNLGGKGSDVHKAAVVGDTVGDPFKDTSGPSMNILINVMAIVSLVIAPLLG